MLSKFQKIVYDITEEINNSTYKKGDKISSVRQLSQQYSCSKDTVQRALLELKYAGLIYAVPKSGYYVLGKIQESNEQALSFQSYHKNAYEDFRLCLNDSLSQQEPYLFNYYHKNQGLDELILALTNYLSEIDVYANKEDIIVTSGTQQALYILSQMDFPNHKENILLESPTYNRMEDLVKSLNLPFKRIDRHFDGIDLDQLEKIFKLGNIKFFYTMSRFSNPLGLSYSKTDKEKIIFLAEKYDVYIIEDDFLGEFSKSNNVPLHYFDTWNRVIYLKSFSVSVFPSLRIGSLVLPKNLQKPFLTHKSMIDLDTNLIMQKALSLYLANGMFTKNFKILKNFYHSSLEIIEGYLSFAFPNLEYTITPQTLTIKLAHQLKEFNSSLSEKGKLINDNKFSYLQLEISEDTISTLIDLHEDIKKVIIN